MSFSLDALTRIFTLRQPDAHGPPDAGGPGPSAAPTASRPAKAPPPPSVLNADSHPVEMHTNTAGAAMAPRHGPAGQAQAAGQAAPAQTPPSPQGAAPVAAAGGGKPAFRPMTADQLRAAMPGVPKDKVDEYLSLINLAMEENEINTPERQAAFLAHLAHESDQLRAMRERASGAGYEPGTERGKRLGNTQPGDGERFKGRGPIQLTGRWNYTAAGRALGVDLAKDPDLVATNPEVGFRAAGWFWRTKGLNAHADRGDFREISRRIVGRYDDPSVPNREAFHATSKKALGVP